MTLTSARFTADAPDGYQIIDVTTGEPFHFKDNQILTYALAREVRRDLNHDQYVIVAVTRDEVARNLDFPSEIEYVPGFVTFAGARETQDDLDLASRLPTVHVDPEDGPDEITLSPPQARDVITAAGLHFLPGARAQHRWPLMEAREQIQTAMSQIEADTQLYDNLKQLAQLATAVNCNGGYYVVLDYNGVDAMAFAPGGG